MTDTFTLTITEVDTPGQAPAHESDHPHIAAATAALGTILREAGEVDRAVSNSKDSSDDRQVYDLIDMGGELVGNAVIARMQEIPDHEIERLAWIGAEALVEHDPERFLTWDKYSEGDKSASRVQLRAVLSAYLEGRSE